MPNMNVQAPAPETVSTARAPISPREINRSCCLPVTVLLASSVGWLVVASVLGLISAIKLHAPGLLSGTAWLTYGRVYPAYSFALIYGFAAPAGLGLGLWILARLSRAAAFGPIATMIAGLFWNFGVLVGTLGILSGAGAGYEGLEVPGFASPILLASYLALALFAILTLHFRSERELYVSQWYLLMALFWFPWIFTTAEMLVVYFPSRGVVQAVIAGWFVHNLYWIWMASLGLAAVFYFLPKLTGQPLHSRGLAMFGFWSLACFGGWGGVQGGTPAPSWLASVSGAAGIMMLVPLLAVAVNWHMTMKGKDQKLAPSPFLPFFKFGAFCFILASLLQIVGLLRAPASVSGHSHDLSETVQSTFALAFGLLGQFAEVARFTHYGNGVSSLFLFGFFAMVAAGGIYYAVPKLTQCEWPAPELMKWHFRCAAAGAALLAASLIIGGIRQGAAMNNPSLAFLETVRSTVPFLGLGTLGMLLLLVGNCALGINFARLLLNCRCSECCPSPTNPGGRS
jgi:cytochrome c oxidase cbb3-type subunit 1